MINASVLNCYWYKDILIYPREKHYVASKQFYYGAVQYGAVQYHYTPGIYADGYIVFVSPFVRLYVRSFVLPSRL